MSSFYTYGIPETREFVSIHKDESGEMRWSDIKPAWKHLLDDPIAPWNLPNAASADPAEYPDFLWTPPVLVDLVDSPKPPLAANQIAEPVLVWTDTGCTRDWVVRDMTPSELADSLRKVWPSSVQFLGEFTMPELGGIGVSIDPTIAAMRLILSSWIGPIYSDDPRVVMGLAALEANGVITAVRRAQISPAPAAAPAPEPPAA